MPGARRNWGCKFRCCLIWWYRDGRLYIGCAHCPKIATKIDDPAGGPEVLARAVSISHEGHKIVCGRPIRG